MRMIREYPVYQGFDIPDSAHPATHILKKYIFYITIKAHGLV